MKLSKPDSKQQDDFLWAKLESSLKIPVNLDADELEKFLLVNLKDISGTLTYYMNDEVLTTIKIYNGQRIDLPTTSQLSKEITGKSSSCSYRGVQLCTQNVVYNQWSTYTALKCAFTGGLWCIFDEAMSCTEKLCIK